MTLGQKIKEIRKRMGLSQEQLGKIINVSRQAITKWERDEGTPDISNLKELSTILGVTVDYLISNNTPLPALSMKIKLNKEKYKNKLSSYEEILKEYYKEPWEIFILSTNKKINKLERILNIFTGGDYYLIKGVSDLSPYYLAVKDNLKLLINIKNWTMEVIELPEDTSKKKITYKDMYFINCGKLKYKNK